MNASSRKSTLITFAVLALVAACATSDDPRDVTDDISDDISDDVGHTETGVDTVDSDGADADDAAGVETGDAEEDGEGGTDARPDSNGGDDASDVPLDTNPDPGACANDDDLELFAAGTGFLDECAEECATAPNRAACARPCLVEVGLSEDCADCGAELLSCVILVCSTACEAGEDECDACIVVECQAGFSACSGINDLGEEEPPDDEVIPNPVDSAFFNVVNVATGGSVDAWHGERTPAIVTALERASARQAEVEPSDDSVAFRTSPSTTADEVIATGDFERGYGPGEIYSVGLIGAGADRSVVLIREVASDPPDGVRWRFVNALAGNEAFDVWEMISHETPVIILEGLVASAVSDAQSWSPQAYSLGFDLDRSGTPDAVFEIGEIPLNDQLTFWLTATDAHPVALLITEKEGTSRLVLPSEL